MENEKVLHEKLKRCIGNKSGIFFYVKVENERMGPKKQNTKY